MDTEVYSEYANNKIVLQRKQRDKSGSGGSYLEKKGIESNNWDNLVWDFNRRQSVPACYKNVSLTTSIYLNPVRTKLF